MPKTKRKIAILGYGRFGKLLYNLLRKHEEVFVWSRSQVRDRGVREISLKELRSVDIVIIAIPISGMEKFISRISSHISPHTIVLDVASVKVMPTRWLQKYLPESVEILGTHPLFGPDSARRGTRGLHIVFCPVRIKGDSLKMIKNILKPLELKITTTTPREHDRRMAKDLALVHFVGRALDKVGLDKSDFGTRGYERLRLVNETVVNDSWQLFYDMQKYNPYAKIVRQKFIKSLLEIEEDITKRLL